MKPTLTAIILITCLSTALVLAEDTFQLTSSGITEGQEIGLKYRLNAYGCAGENISPALEWSNAPIGTKSFVVTLYDPDTKSGSGWWHWVMFNIPANVSQLKQGAGSGDGAPKGAIHTRTDFGTSGFAGSCPPPGKVHRYQYRVYALGVESLELDGNATPAMVGFMARANAIGIAELTAVLTR